MFFFDQSMRENRFTYLLFGLIALALSLKGWGSTELYQFSIVIFLVAALHFQQNTSKLLTLCQVFLAITIALLPQYSHLSALLAIIALCSGRWEAILASNIIFLIAALWMYDITSRNVSPLVIICFGSALIGICYAKRVCKALFYIALILWAINPITDLTRMIGGRTITIESYKKEGIAVFPHGDVICRQLDAEKRERGEADGDIGIANLIFGETNIKAKKKLFLVEHGVGASEKHQALGKNELLQKKPWEFNQFYGEEHILASIAQDGYWASNLGGSIEPKDYGGVALASKSHTGGKSFETIIFDHNDRRYVQDSDPFVDWLAHGQRHVTKEVSKGQTSLRLLNLIVALLCLLVVVTERHTVNMMASFASLLLIWGHWLYDVNSQPNGEVCIVGKVGSPHELSKSAGVLRSMIESGHPVTETSKLPIIVVVSEGKSYKLQGSERLVIAASNSEIITPKGSFKVDDVPQGLAEDIVDSRLIKGPAGKDATIHKLDNLTILGTNSPAKQNWNKWLSF